MLRRLFSIFPKEKVKLNWLQLCEVRYYDQVFSVLVESVQFEKSKCCISDEFSVGLVQAGIEEITFSPCKFYEDKGTENGKYITKNGDRRNRNET